MYKLQRTEFFSRDYIQRARNVRDISLKAFLYKVANPMHSLEDVRPFSLVGRFFLVVLGAGHR